MTDKREAWEQPIYDEKNSDDTVISRAEQRTKKKGDSAFITILVLLLLAIAGLLIFMFNQGKKPLNDKEPVVEVTQSTASKEEKEAKAAKEKAAKEAKEQTSETKAETEVTTAPETENNNLTPQETVDNPVTEDAQEKNDTATSSHAVQAGETAYNIATTNGMSVDELLALNPGLDINNMQIGQSLVLK